jgi:class 3 adenylate cyclase
MRSWRYSVFRGAHEDDALRAVRVAAEMQGAVEPLELKIRIGVNTGEVVTGEGGTLVTGDAVNVAARLEQVASPGEILIGTPTLRLVRDAVNVEAVSTCVGRREAECDLASARAAVTGRERGPDREPRPGRRAGRRRAAPHCRGGGG